MTKKLTVEDLWKFKRPSGVSVSPDGAQAVVTVSSSDMAANTSSTALWLLSTLGGKPRLLTTGGDKDGQAAWSPASKNPDLIAFVAKREQGGVKDEAPQLYVIDPAGGEARRVTTLATGVAAPKWFADGRRVAFVSWVWPDLKGEKAQTAKLKAHDDNKVKAYVVEHQSYRYWDRWIASGRVPHLFVCDTQTGKCADLFEGSSFDLSHAEPDVNCFDIAPDGKAIVFAHDASPSKRLDNEFDVIELELKTKKFRNLTAKVPLDFAAPRYSHDGRRIACLSTNLQKRHTELARLTLVDVASGKHKVLSNGWDRGVNAPLRWAADDSCVLFMAESDARTHLWQFALDAHTPEVVVQGGVVAEFDVAADRAVLVRHSMNTPPQVFAASLPVASNVIAQNPIAAATTAYKIETFNDALLAQFSFGKTEELYYQGFQDAKAKSQHKAHLWIIYPPGFDAKKKYPLMHSIHGGPHTASSDGWHFRWNNHAFAAQGYIVVCVNYHGSSSFGFAFQDSITYEWGKRELADIEAATDLLIKRPYVDAKRLFATGGSYGGYMVAWMNAHVKKGRYQAYICHAGCFDWVSMFADDAYYWHAKELGGYYWDKPQLLESQNPRAFAKSMETPTLVIHGLLDYRVPDGQGLQYYNTLKAKGVDARLVFFPDENHWILKPQNSRLWYGEFFAWLGRYDTAGVAKKLAANPAKAKAAARKLPK